MSLKDLARQAGVNTEAKKSAVKAPAAKEVKTPEVKTPEVKTEPVKEATPATVSDLLDQVKANNKEKPAKDGKASKPRVKVDSVWIEALIKRANEKFGKTEQFDKASVDFTIAKSKGRYVSLTPKLVYEDGTIKSAGPKNRVGFCSNSKWDDWYVRLEEALVAAHSAERKTPTTRKMSGQWASFSQSVKDVMGDEISVKSISKKLMIKGKDSDRVTLRREGDIATIGNASGNLDFVAKVLESVKVAEFTK